MKIKRATMRCIRLAICLMYIFLALSVDANRRPLSEQLPPKEGKPSQAAGYIYWYQNFKVHNNNAFQTTVFNNGVIGNLYGVEDPSSQATYAGDNYFPRGHRIRHGYFTAPWVGGIIGNDTLVSTAIDCDFPGYWGKFENELMPDWDPPRAYLDFSPEDYEGGYNNIFKSQYTFQCSYSDTSRFYSFTPFNPYDARLHLPMDIKITQTSYSWSYRYAEDFIMLDYKVENVGNDTINDLFFGLYHEGGVHHIAEPPRPALDDIAGYLDSVDYEYPGLGKEPIEASWVCDVNGNPWGGKWSPYASKHVVAFAPIYKPPEAIYNNFNWWVEFGDYNWGPRRKLNPAGAVRDFHGYLGIPRGDKDKYYMMAHPEIDYSGYEAAMDHSFEGWLPPSDFGEDIANGRFIHFVTSFGPVQLKPNEWKRYTLVMAAGENLHVVPNWHYTYFYYSNPYKFMDGLDFSDLINNIHWAKRIYDNPGVDSDGDGDSGKYVYVIDSITFDSTQVYYEGDGVPDFQGAGPPPPPQVRISTEAGKLRIRWNGRDTENNFDNFSGLRDFEGYRVYLARTPIESDFSLQSSYDRKNYSRLVWSTWNRTYELKDTPFSLDRLKKLYGESFNPDEYTRTDPFGYDGKYYIFVPVDNNQSELLDPNLIHKVYPDAVNDTSDVDEEGRMRFYEYEYVIDNLLPTIPYYISVTAFDFGYPAKSLDPLESNPLQNVVEAFAVGQDENELLAEGLKIYVYPNPYRVDGNYTNDGFERRTKDIPADKGRALYFANLPPGQSRIKIYSLDGDLVRTIIHDDPSGSGTATIEKFDLITKNNMAMTTGLYYWVVETDYGNQIGKLVVLK